jgi:hypothetical protein
LDAERQRATAAAYEAIRARDLLEHAKRRAELAEAKLAELTKQLQAERDQARAAEQAARAAAERFRDALEKATAWRPPEPKVQAVAVADANGKNLPIPEALQGKIEEKVIAALLNSGGELVASGGGPPFANADRWTRAEKGAHVKVHFPQKRTWPGNSPIGKAGVSDILIPMTDRQAPDYVLIHDGDTFRAFFNLPEATVKDLQKLLAELE